MPGQQQVVQNGHAAEQFQVLKSPGNAQLGYLVRAGLGKLSIAIMNFTGGGMIKAGNTVEQAGFAGTVGPDDRGDQAGFDVDVHIWKVHASPPKVSVTFSIFNLDMVCIVSIRLMEEIKREPKLRLMHYRRRQTPFT